MCTIINLLLLLLQTLQDTNQIEIMKIKCLTKGKKMK